MFFHIDESGNTGNNLFDENQPKLSYGLLSSKTNVDAVGVSIHKKMLKELGVKDIHANVLGVDKLTKIVPLLYELQKKMDFDFDYYFIDKPSYALVLFFDAVFDAGLNEAVKWDVYWTPLRFMMIHKLSVLFDESLLKESWELCIHKKIETQDGRVVALLTELLSRVEDRIPDARSRELISDAFKYGIANPLVIDFGVTDEKMVSPNAVGFQFVVTAMAARLRKKKRKNATSIVVDLQNQFNKSQIGTHYNQTRLSEGLKSATEKDQQRYTFHPLYVGFDRDTVLGKSIPEKDITISSSDKSIGLQIVDVYLWIVNRHLNGSSLSDELKVIGSMFLGRSMVDGISMEGMAKRWSNFEKLLPAFEDLTEENHEMNKEMVEYHRSKVEALDI